MRIARPLGLAPEGDRLIVVTDDGEEIAIPADDRLRAALRSDRPRLGQLEIQMDSALRPRDIQARIRAGESLDEVARAAGVPVERLDAFAAPVIAEREHVAGLAQVHPVRRRGETTSHRTLRNAVADQLAARGIDPADVTWDAWKIEDRRWQVQARYRSGSSDHEALFAYEQVGRFSTATNDEARWLIGDSSPLHGPQPGRRPPHRASEGDDDLALVLAVQDAGPQDVEEDEATVASGDAEPTVPVPGVVASGDGAADEADADAEDAFTEGELAEVDGVYDIVPSRSDMDVLYDMLSSFDEDSVKIYAGLIHPDPAEVVPPTGEPEPEPAADAPAPSESVEAAGPVPPSDAPAAPPAPVEPEQPPLVDDDTPSPPRPARRPGRKRASVPSWDEIVFGGPTPPRPEA